MHKSAGNFQHLAPVEARGQAPRCSSMCSVQASKGPDHHHTHIHTPCSTWAGPLVFEQLLKLPDGVGLDWIYTSCQPDSYPQQRAHQHSGLKHEGVLLQSELSSPFSITSCTKLFLLSLFSAVLFLFPL